MAEGADVSRDQSPVGNCPAFSRVSPRTRASLSGQGSVSPRLLSAKRAFSLRNFHRESVESDDSMLDSIYDDDFLNEDGHGRRCWRTVHAVFMLTYAGRKFKPHGEFNQLAGHSGNFRTEDGYVLKALTMNEGATLESLQRERSLRGFAPQYMGCVEREGRTYIKMQDVMLSMGEPNFMDIKMGLRTFAEAEVQSNKRRMDLLEKALVIQQKIPSVYISDDEKKHGMTKYRFMSLRDHASSSATLGFRIQGMMKDQKTLTSKDFSSHRSAVVCRSIFRNFFAKASAVQRAGLLQRLEDLHHAASNSEWFATHEVIGSSLLIGYDSQHPEKFGVWMIDFARTESSPTRLTHTRPWTLGSREDGYLVGVQSLIKIWSDEFRGDIPLVASDWHYRAEGHDCIVMGYHGPEPTLCGKVLRLAKEAATQRFHDTLAGHPATAYNDFVCTMLADYIGPAADAGQVVHVDKFFLEAIAAQVKGIRPEFRAMQSGLDLESEYQLLLQDGSYVPGARHEATIAVELKLKMGHLPPPTSSVHWIKGIVSRFAMQQYLKLRQGTTGKISEYCPIDLFSGDFDRTQNVLFRLLDTPQNNLRVFLGDALLVPQKEGKASSLQSGKQVLDSRLATLLGGCSLPPSLYLSELLAKCLLQPCSRTGVPLMKKIQNLQRIGLDIETLWPLVQHSVQELEMIYHVDHLDVAAVTQSLPPSPPLYCHAKQQRMRRGQQDNSLSALRAEYHAMRAVRDKEVEAVEARVKDFDGVLEIRKFLLSQSLKDASLMVSLAEVTEGTEAAQGPDVVHASDGRCWRYSLRLMDLDAKNVNHLRKWFELDQEIVRTYLKEAFGTEDAPLEEPSQCNEQDATPPTALEPPIIDTTDTTEDTPRDEPKSPVIVVETVSFRRLSVQPETIITAQEAMSTTTTTTTESTTTAAATAEESTTPKASNHLPIPQGVAFSGAELDDIIRSASSGTPCQAK